MEDVLIAMLLLVLVAATAAPRFSKAASENKLPAMIESLHRVRSSIEVYRIDHEGLLPGQADKGQCIDCESFGKAITAGGKDNECYLGEIPANPFIEGDAAREITIVHDVDASPCGTEGTGWWLNSATGEFRASDSRFHSVY
jgi:type II secretory pathway pseudopilin PulG